MRKKIINCVNQTLVKLYQQTAKAIELNQIVRSYLPDELATFCKISHFHKGCLTIAVKQAGIANKIQYLLPELRNNLRKKEQLYQLSSIKLIIEKPINKKDKKKTIYKNTLNPSVSLDDALQKLENHLKEKKMVKLQRNSKRVHNSE